MAYSNTRLSPRQKMINLMYIVLIAMLALNVSGDVLDGFTQVEEGLSRTNVTVDRRNTAIYAELKRLASENPEKMAGWITKADSVRLESSRLYGFIDSLKLAIVREADGNDGKVEDIDNRENVDAAAVVMLNPANGKGKDLRIRVDRFRSGVNSIIVDPVRKNSVEAALSTRPFRRKGFPATSTWEETKFENQPVVAAITLLTKLQNDTRYAEGEALLSIAALSQGKSIAEVTGSDMVANSFKAFVVPQSKIVMRGGRYKADVLLAAVDTLSRPDVFIGGKQLPGGLYEFSPSSAGTFSYSGFIRVPHADGTFSEHNFTDNYTVVKAYATVSASMMNVLYAGIDNPVSISVPGFPQSSVLASMTNGTLIRKGDSWLARPSAIGKDAVITVSADVDGVRRQVATHTFRVRKLPDPAPYISIGNDRFKGGRPVGKQAILGAGGVKAAIDDGLLDIQFNVIGFEMIVFDSMGNAIPEVSDGASFSRRQKEAIQKLGRGKRFFISRIRAKGPDGTVRNLSPMEIIIN